MRHHRVLALGVSLTAFLCPWSGRLMGSVAWAADGDVAGRALASGKPAPNAVIWYQE
jgi:hypothetical protein